MKKLLRSILWTALACLLLLAGVVLFFDVQRRFRESDTLELAAPSSGRLIQTADARVFVQEAGSKDGTPVLFMHGTGTWSEVWRETLDTVAKEGYRAIAIDIPPFGYSEKLNGAGSYARQAQARRILGVLDGLGIGQAILVGHSVGARATVEAALLAPERVSKLILVDPALGFSTDETLSPAFQQNQPSSLMKTIFKAKPLRNAILSTYGTNPLFVGSLVKSFVYRESAVTPELISILRRPFSLTNTTGAYGDWLENLSISGDDSLGSDLSNLKKLRPPVVLIWGRRDSTTPLWQGEALRTLIPGASLHVLEDVGHIPYLEDVAAFNSTLIRILSTGEK